MLRHAAHVIEGVRRKWLLDTDEGAIEALEVLDRSLRVVPQVVGVDANAEAFRVVDISQRGDLVAIPNRVTRQLQLEIDEPQRTIPGDRGSKHVRSTIAHNGRVVELAGCRGRRDHQLDRHVLTSREQLEHGQFDGAPRRGVVVDECVVVINPPHQGVERIDSLTEDISVIREECLSRGEAFARDILARAALPDPGDVISASGDPDALRGRTDSGTVREGCRERDVEPRELQLHGYVILSVGASG